MQRMSIKVALNAQLLAKESGYRAAGIHNVIHQSLLHLPRAAPQDWSFTAFVSQNHPAQYDGITMQQADWDTERPTRRIMWEQLLQPRHLIGYDLYHAMAFVAPLVLPVPMVVTVYDLTFMRYPQRLTTARRLYLRALTALTCRRAKRILAISHSTKRDLVELLGIPEEKIVVTPLGYDRERFRPLPPETIAAFKQGQGLPERFWLYVGTLEPRKNLVTLVHAYAALPAHERLPLILAGGKGWMTDDLFAAIEQHSLGDHIHLPGFIPDEDLALWYNSAEAFIFPSVFEGFGLPVLEAMACGTPVITSNVSSLPEVAEGAGLCLPPHAVSLWTETLNRVYYDAAWREEAQQKGLAKAQQFSWEAMARLTLDAYQQTL